MAGDTHAGRLRLEDHQVQAQPGPSLRPCLQMEKKEKEETGQQTQVQQKKQLSYGQTYTYSISKNHFGLIFPLLHIREFISKE